MGSGNEEPKRAHPGFFALEPRYADPQRAAATILPVPFDATSTWKKGADSGPEAMLEASTMVELYDIETHSEPWLHGIATLPPIDVEVSAERLAVSVQGRVAEILEDDRLPVVVGGEHSVTIGAVSAAADRYPDLSVLQIDAHADTREVLDGSTHNHGCVMARARERCPIVQVGIRSLAASEMARIDESRVFWAHEIAAARHLPRSRDDGLSEGTRWGWMDAAVDLLTDDVYVTIDLDGFDPGFVPATGTPEPGGLDWYEVNGLLERVAARRRVRAFDVVELLPAPGDHASAFKAAKLLYRFLALIWRDRKPPAEPPSVAPRHDSPLA